MQSITAYRPMNRWNHDSIQPGLVGTVGDALPFIKLRTSTPDMAPVYDGTFMYSGGNFITDGQPDSAETFDSNWNSGRHFKTSLGWQFQDITRPDTSVEPYVSSLGDYTWRNKIATVYEARRTGENFLPLPGQFDLKSGVPRGGSYPQVTNVEGVEVPEVGVVSRGTIGESNIVNSRRRATAEAYGRFRSRLGRPEQEK